MRSSCEVRHATSARRTDWHAKQPNGS
jgi:hypothetical protein